MVGDLNLSLPLYWSTSHLNFIRGKNSVGKATKEDDYYLFQLLDKIEQKLDDADDDDTFGTEGWKRHFGL